MLVAASLIVSALVAGIGSQIHDAIGVPPFVVEIINNLVSSGVFTGLLYFIVPGNSGRQNT